MSVCHDPTDSGELTCMALNPHLTCIHDNHTWQNPAIKDVGAKCVSRISSTSRSTGSTAETRMRKWRMGECVKYANNQVGCSDPDPNFHYGPPMRHRCIPTGENFPYDSDGNEASEHIQPLDDDTCNNKCNFNKGLEHVVHLAGGGEECMSGEMAQYCKCVDTKPEAAAVCTDRSRGDACHFRVAMPDAPTEPEIFQAWQFQSKCHDPWMNGEMTCMALNPSLSCAIWKDGVFQKYQRDGSECIINTQSESMTAGNPSRTITQQYSMGTCTTINEQSYCV